MKSSTCPRGLALAVVLGLLQFLPAAWADDPIPGKQVERSFRCSDGAEVPYLFYLPGKEGQLPEGKLPLLMFLHGSGERNGPLSIVAKWGPPRLAAAGQPLPFVIVSPQCPQGSRWSDDVQRRRLTELLDHLSSTYPVDSERLYLTGLSMGGHGTWSWIAAEPERFAAAVPICGRGDVAAADRLKDLPLWVFHGTEDTAVPYSGSQQMVDAIRAAGGTKVRFTSLEHVGHNSWSAAYATPELYSWLASHRR